MYRFLLSGLLFFCLLQTAQAQQNKIPEDLQQWIPWVLYEQEEKTCTLRAGKTTERYCTWPSSLQLTVDQNGATFTQKYFIETRSLVPLPGSVPFWPSPVQSNGEDLLVSRSGNQPAIWLDPGEHSVTGSFFWNSLPENLFIPPATGLVELTLHGKKTRDIQLDDQGRLWFKQKKRSKKADEESLSLQVFRKIEDGVPLLQHLRIQLTVSGPPRQISLGLTSENDFIPLTLESPLPIRFDEQNRLQLQIRPGQWNIRLTLRNSLSRSPENIGMGMINGPWPEQEIWVFAADPKLRQVEIKDVSPIDPSRTSLPDDWKRLPAYLVPTDSKMNLFEKNRGNPSPVPNRLSVNRKLWLDEEGGGLTVFDFINGTMTRDWRLNVDASMQLGKVDVEGRPRLITKLKQSGQTGVEIRKGRLSLQAESRINTPVQTGHLIIPAIGWEHNVQNLSGVLNLPPGWKLFSASGVDRVSTWLTRWSLLDIFMVLITALATIRILGWGWGIAALLTLTLCFHQVGSPRYLWLPLLGVLGLQKMIASATAERVTSLSSLLILVALIISSIPYMVKEIRVGIFPQLEYGSYRKIGQEYHMQASTMQTREAEVMDDAVMTEPGSRSKALKKKSIAGAHYGINTVQQIAKPQKMQIDPKDMIQTGPGLPDWNWTQINLHWNGPVKPEQKISFLLLSPLSNTILAFVRVLLLTLLLLGFLRKCIATRQKRNFSNPVKNSSMFLFLLLCGAFFPPNSSADIPSPEILQELQERLLAPPNAQRIVSVSMTV